MNVNDLIGSQYWRHRIGINGRKINDVAVGCIQRQQFAKVSDGINVGNQKS